jgi:hypothetical protein
MTVLALPTPDWLAHTLTVSGPARDVTRFQDAAAGAGVIPWHYDLDRMQEDWFHHMLVPGPATREISVEGARILAETYRGLVGAHHERVLAVVGHSRACPLDLYALVPIPDRILRLGPDDPAGLLWLWENWGTTRSLKQVRILTDTADRRLRRSGRLDYAFLSADWTPWQAILTIQAQWPALEFDVRPNYGCGLEKLDIQGSVGGRGRVAKRDREGRSTPTPVGDRGAHRRVALP